ASGATTLLDDGSGYGFPVSVNALDVVPSDLRLADLDGDGNLDLLAALAPSNDLILRLGNGLGGFAPKQKLPIGGAAIETALADFDGDGRLDIAATLFNKTQIALLANLGGGAFAAPLTLDVPDKLSQIAAADLDGDARPDLVVSGSYADLYV